MLNYGHTLAHALERSSDFKLAHGEAVAIGMIFAAHLAHSLQRIDDVRLAYHYKVIRDSYGLGVAIPNTADRQTLIDLMRLDKKAIDGLTFVLDGVNGVEMVSDISEKYLHRAFDAMQLI